MDTIDGVCSHEHGSRLSCVAHHRPAASSAWQASARLRPSSNLCYPPAQANEKEAPVLEELRRLPLNGVADELEGPPDHEKAQRHRPEPVHEHGRDKQRDRGRNERNANGVAEAVHRVLMAECVLGNPGGHRTIGEHVLSSKGYTSRSGATRTSPAHYTIRLRSEIEPSPPRTGLLYRGC